MTTTGLADHAQKFRSAVESHDMSRAQTALQEYAKCFGSRSRTLPEVEEARNLLRWAIQAARARKARMAEELMLLKRIVDAYRPPRRFHTWRIDG